MKRKVFLLIATLWYAGTMAIAFDDGKESRLRYLLSAEKDRLVDREAELATVRNRGLDTAWWQSGFVKGQDQWLTYDEAVSAAKQGDSFETYEAERAASGDSPEGHLRLASWCRRNDMLDRERAHLTEALTAKPRLQNERLLKRAGFERVLGGWMSKEQRDRLEAEVARIDDSLNHWRQKLLRIDRQLAGTASMQRKALSDLKEIVDPNAVAAIDLILGRHPRLDTARAAMRTLRQIDGYEASQVLAKYAVFSDIPTIRREATEHLSGRRYEDFVPGMISLMATEVQGSLAEIWDGCGKFPPLISEIAVYLKLERETGDQIQVSYTRFRLVPRIVKMISLGLDGRDYRRAGSPTVASIVVDSAFHATRRRVDEVNEESAELNGRVSQVLSSLTGRNRTDAPDYWWKWWNHERDVESGLKPVVEVVEVGEGISIEQPTF
jgi:hypothetical protein